VLKGYDKSYFSFNRIKLFTKLKKDYISGLGDTIDLIIINRRRDVKNKEEFSIGKL